MGDEASAIWSPMVNIGVRADSDPGTPWAIRSPRISLISSSVLPMSSSPFMMMEPVTLALSSSRPIRLNAVTDLPEPDSPTMPSVRPRHRSKLTPRTARHTPASVAKDTCRSRTCMIGSPFGAPWGRCLQAARTGGCRRARSPCARLRRCPLTCCFSSLSF